MARLTKADIEKTLLAGDSLSFADASGSQAALQLTTPTQRRLFEYLLGSSVRLPTSLPAEFIAGLQKALEATHDPAIQAATASHTPLGSAGPWKLSLIEAEGFGGLNTWQGEIFTFDLACESFVLEGPNGSGKSSLIGAVTWALTGQRPREQSEIAESEKKPVYGNGPKPVGQWPPLACYPPTTADAEKTPKVRVKLTFRDPGAQTATVERKLLGDTVSTSVSSNFQIPLPFIEVGLLMPSRIGRIRLNEPGNRLKSAVEQLTGLDDLIAIGSLTAGLCHAAREYRSYRAKELIALRSSFNRAVETARVALARVNMPVAEFKPADTEDTSGPMVALGKQLSELAAEQANVIKNDLHPSIQLGQARVQNEVVAYISAARQDFETGLAILPAWKTVSSIQSTLSLQAAASLEVAINTARSSLDEALVLLRKSQLDTKFQLKAIGAHWHEENLGGIVADCPLCSTPLSDLVLKAELEELRKSGDAARRAFADNTNAIVLRLNEATPAELQKFDLDLLALEPRRSLIDDITSTLISNPRYRDCLVGAKALVESALKITPDIDVQATLPPSGALNANDAARVLERILIAERLVALAKWSATESARWTQWWSNLVEGLSATDTEGSPPIEGIRVHLDRLSEILEKAEPYRTALESMRTAFKEGKQAADIQREVDLRTLVSEGLAPLKTLNGVCDWVTRNALDELSGRIGGLLKEILVAEQLQYQSAALDRKEGLRVQANFSADLSVDATVVANTSWIRAVLWAFVFALREELVEQFGRDCLPLMMFDDPQSTFDDFHRSRWANYIAKLQHESSSVQIIITTHDIGFVDLIKMDGVTGRDGLLIACGPRSDRATVLEGAKIDRAWAIANTEKTPKAAQDYLADVREYAEGLLKTIVRGRDGDVRMMALGDLRDLLERSNKAGLTPWDAPVIGTVLALIRKGSPETSYIEGPHHTTGRQFGMQEATAVRTLWKKLGPAIEGAYRTIRDYRKLHGGMELLFSTPATAEMPDGHQAAVRTIPLKILGRAAALSDGRAADGTIDMSEYKSVEQIGITLGKHSAFRLTAPTLEPVARVGDILITREYGEVSNRSLVVARFDDRLLARRLEISDNVNNVAALTAQAVNPREIAAPVVTHRGSLDVRKIVGVLFEKRSSSAVLQTSRNEICDCGGQAALTHLAKTALGIVEVEGKSAEPLALDGQYLIVQDALTSQAAINAQDGRPVIVEDSNGTHYFKRLRLQPDGGAVLESLHSGGEYWPIVLSPVGSKKNCLQKLWPVAGVLFELPGKAV
ncbi:AAA family ATPase [Bradyrhizobium sp. CAR08]